MIGREGKRKDRVLTLNNIKYNRKTKGKINTFFFCFSICILFNVRRREKIWPRPTAQDKLKIEYLLFIGRGEGWVVSSLSRSPTFPFLLSFLFLLFVFLLYVYFYFILSFAILIPYISFSKIANHKIEINKEKQRERKERSKWKLDTRGLEFRVWKVAHWLANQTLNTPRVSKLPTFPLLGFSRNNRQAQVLFRNQAKKRKTRNKWNIVEYDILDPLFSISYFYLSFVCLFSFLLRCPLPRYAAANAQGSIGLFCNLYLYSQHIIS